MLLKNLLRPYPSAPRFLTFLFLFTSCLSVSSQKVTEVVFDGVAKNRIEQDVNFTAIAIRPSEGFDSDSYPIKINELKEQIPLDPDSEEIIFFKSLQIPGNSFEINPTFRGSIFLINSGKIAIEESKSFQSNSSDCFTFVSVPQSSWREGLPAPNFDRIQNNVSHLIVHHTAGPNINTNYTQVVRDIYLFHTEVNQWFDIGYNFLVAQDGAIFEGRDPGNNLTEFEVVGAHFCGKNTGTMGVAMLGNFESADPTDDALLSLQKVLASAADNFNISVLERSDHRGSILGHIAGHRDGCSTLCPGKTLYPLLSKVSLSVSNLLECIPEDSVIVPLTFSFFPNPVSSVGFLNVQAPDSIDKANLVSLSGKVWESIPIEGGQMNLANIPSGVYILRLDGYQSQKVVITN